MHVLYIVKLAIDHGNSDLDLHGDFFHVLFSLLCHVIVVVILQGVAELSHVGVESISPRFGHVLPNTEGHQGFLHDCISLGIVVNSGIKQMGTIKIYYISKSSALILKNDSNAVDKIVSLHISSIQNIAQSSFAISEKLALVFYFHISYLLTKEKATNNYENFGLSTVRLCTMYMYIKYTCSCKPQV